MARRRGRCKKFVGYLGKRRIYCGMPLDEQGNCPEHGKNTS